MTGTTQSPPGGPVRRRVTELREARFEGMQTIGEFLERDAHAPDL